MDDLYLASYTLRRGLDDLPVDIVERFWKVDGNLRSVVDEVYDISSQLLGSKVGEILVYVGWSELEWIDTGAVYCMWDTNDFGMGGSCTVNRKEYVKQKANRLIFKSVNYMCIYSKCGVRVYIAH